MKAVIYTRVSTEEQTKNLSLPTQLRVCREYCEREGYEVVRVFTDRGESAKTTDRPEFRDLLAFCRLHKQDVQILVVYNISRFSRYLPDYSVIRLMLLGWGISLRSVNEPIGDEPTGALMGNILAAIAQFDNDEKARRTKVGMTAALELGRWTFQAPLGYLNKQSCHGRLALDPVRGPLVRAAFELYAEGRDSKSDVLRRVNALGLTSRAGKPLTGQTLGAMLRNPIYHGWVHVPRWGVSARGDFEALVPESLFRRVQALLDEKGKALRHRARNHPDFPLRRFITCTHCSAPLTGSFSTGRSKKYAYYHCPKCRRVKATKKELEERFIALLTLLEPEAGYLRLFNEIVLDVWKGRQGEAKRLRANLERVVREKRERLDCVDDAYIHQKTIDRQTYERQRDQLREQIGLAEIELGDVVSEQLNVDGVLAFAEHVLTNAARLWMELGLDQKQRLQQVLFPEGLRFDGERFGTAATCLAFNKLAENGESESRMASPTGFEPVS
ncbi:MAG: recombinase family protein [Chloroflexi bacterium]|nr:recombinase family protein [Chloroflexota bacterium]